MIYSYNEIVPEWGGWDELHIRSNLDESFKKCAERKKSDTKVRTVQFHLYEILEYAN